jgi:hypothetical protein
MTGLLGSSLKAISARYGETLDGAATSYYPYAGGRVSVRMMR